MESGIQVSPMSQGGYGIGASPVSNIHFSVEQVLNGFLISFNWNKHIAKDKTEVLTILTDLLK